MESVLADAFLCGLLVTGLLCALLPEWVVKVRRKLCYSNDMLSGGYFYASAARTRVMGVVLLVVVGVCIGAMWLP